MAKSYHLPTAGQVPNEISLARSEKELAPGVGRWELSAPVRQNLLFDMLRDSHRKDFNTVFT